MKKCIIIPDSYKGTLSAIQICQIMKQAVTTHYPDCQVIAMPVADGGEGTVDCFLYALDAEKIYVDTTGPYGEPLKTYYARFDDTAVIEMASAAGLPLVEDRLNPCQTTTYGIGNLFRHAIENGCRQIVFGLGGSCTNDGGVGLAQSLGTVFYNKEGKQFTPSAAALSEISRIDNSATLKLLKDCSVTAMCDIDNPMYGPQGAAYIFAPQKGADAAMVELLDIQLKALAGVIKSSLGIDAASIPGSGAAGALGAGVVAFLGGNLKPGIETILDLIHFDDLLDGTDMVFTGEGKIDSQSLRGKVVIGIGERAKKKNIPVTVIAGTIGDGISEAYKRGISAIFSINRTATDFSKSRHYSDISLRDTMDDIIRFYKATHH